MFAQMPRTSAPLATSARVASAYCCPRTSQSPRACRVGDLGEVDRVQQERWLAQRAEPGCGAAVEQRVVDGGRLPRGAAEEPDGAHDPTLTKAARCGYGRDEAAARAVLRAMSSSAARVAALAS